MVRLGVLSVFLLLSHFHSVAQARYKIVAIGSYNCENMFDTLDDKTKQDDDFTPNGGYHYTAKVYKEKLHNIATVISQMGTDKTPDGAAIVGLVEVENNTVLNDLVAQKELADRNYKVIIFPTPDERGISTAMLYNPKYFTLLNAFPVHVPLETLGQKRPTRDILYVSGVLSGDTVHVLVNHWPSKSGGEAASAPGRKLAAGVAKKIVDSLLRVDVNTKILLLGDLNDNPTSEGVVDVLKAKAKKEDVGLRDIYNPWIDMYRKGLGTENYQGEWSLIDQIMLSGNFLKNSNNKWKYYSSEIFNRDFLKNKFGRDQGLPHRSFTISQVWDNGYSDHFPVLTYLVEKE